MQSSTCVNQSNRLLLLGLIFGVVVVFMAMTSCSARGTDDLPSAAVSATPTPDILSMIDPAARCYIEAINGRDLDKLVNCFAVSGTVVDINQEITGSIAIRQWAQNHVIGGRIKAIKGQPYDGGVIVLVHWAPRTSAGWLVWYRFEFTEGRLTLVNRQNA
jgi:hypothetical protein